MSGESLWISMKQLVCCLFVFALVSMFPGVAFSATPGQQEGTEGVEETVSAAADTYNYNPAGRRDPFEPLINQLQETSRVTVVKPRGPLQKYELTQFRLMAVLVVKGRPMAMVKAPDGKSYPVKIGDEIGRYEGKVANIETKVTDRDPLGKRIEVSPDRIVVEETVRDNFTNKQAVEYRYLTM